MVDEYTTAVAAYLQKWQALAASRKNTEFFAGLQPTALGWKTTDRAEYTSRVAALHDTADQIVETWMNGRWVAKLHLKDVRLAGGIEIIKIMERRPDSTDATGLDHLDFYAPTELAWNEEVLRAEPSLKWSKETNDIIDGYDWLSIWFDGTEAKIKHDTVLDIIAKELTDLSGKLMEPKT
jgi:hypothetical protein